MSVSERVSELGVCELECKDVSVYERGGGARHIPLPTHINPSRQAHKKFCLLYFRVAWICFLVGRSDHDVLLMLFFLWAPKKF